MQDANPLDDNNKEPDNNAILIFHVLAGPNDGWTLLWNRHTHAHTHTHTVAPFPDPRPYELDKYKRLELQQSLDATGRLWSP